VVAIQLALKSPITPARGPPKEVKTGLLNDRTVALAVLAPVCDEGSSFSSRLGACLDAVADIGVQLIVLDNQSIDGCCHGLSPRVLIVRTERAESALKMWRLGLSLAACESVLWLPAISSYSPDRFRAIVLAALNLENSEPVQVPDRRTHPLRFAAALKSPALLTATARSRLMRWERTPAVGGMISTIGAGQLRLVIPLNLKAGSEEQVPAREAFCRPMDRAGSARVSAIITAHNEGSEVIKTVKSVRDNSRSVSEIIVIDDGSTDGSCDGLDAAGVRVIRHPERIGVARSRDVGSRAASGNVFAYLDGHQRVAPGCLDRCAELALIHEAITCPPCRPLHRRYPVSHGATFRLDQKRGFFSASHRTARPRDEVTRISALRSPAYVIPSSAYARVSWIGGLRGWGATDFCVAIKAFFSDIDILHVNNGCTEHLFRKRIPYETSWAGVWRNHALIARVCFDDRTWTRYWLPDVFRKNLGDEVLYELDSPTVLAERDAFMAVKARPDSEFWRGLLRIPEPNSLR
jgi:glycosyltransferase involved in cell wall biosynthesis